MGQDKPAEEVLDELARKAGDYMQAYSSCAQGTLRALQDQFDLGNPEVLKAATAMPGIALRGDTCGAVSGPIMALGLAFGRDKPEDYEAFVRTLQAAHHFCRQFEEEFGSCMCCDIHERLFGRYYDLTDPKEMEEFVKVGGAEKCRIPVEKAVRIVGQMIMEGLSEDT
jgi:C_GCAxxG_C_C family probable redox protein